MNGQGSLVNLNSVLKNLNVTKGNPMPKKEEPPQEQKTIDQAVVEQPAAAAAPEQQDLAPGEIPIQENEKPAAPEAQSTVPAVSRQHPMNDTTEVAPHTGLASALAKADVGQLGVVLRNIDDLWRFSKIVAASGLAPKGMEKIESVAIAIQLGLEIGLSPMSALQNIASINGRPGIYGDAAKALVERSGLLEDFDDWFEHEGKRLPGGVAPAKPNDTTVAFCMSKRKGRRELVRTFSVEDAKRAGLWGKTGPWTGYPGRMLMFRARGFNLRDNFGDVLKGLYTTEEIRDFGEAIDSEIISDSGPISMPQRVSETTAPAAEPTTVQG